MKHLLKRLPITLGSALLLSSHITLAGEYPQIIQHILDRGLSVVADFDATPDMRGYILESQGKPITVYVSKDKQHAFVGTHIDQDGNNLSAETIDAVYYPTKARQTWAELASSHWVADGDNSAPTTIYAFYDPNCPYCQAFREAATPWIQSGQVQLRHILVGVLTPSSLPKAATILGAVNPHTAYMQNVAQHKHGGIAVQESARIRGEPQVQANNQLMQKLGVPATPGIFYKDAEGKLQRHLGMPPTHTLNLMMEGAAKP